MRPRYLTNLNLQDFFETACEIPYQKIDSELFPNIELWIRRDDLLDPLISGNKAYKLIYNLIEVREQGADTLVTCGGAWSNHIHATAAAGARFGFKTVGIIRGERPRVLSPTLSDAERFGMTLRFVSRADYRERHSSGFMNRLGLDGPGIKYVPEGGANQRGAEGVKQLGTILEKTSPIEFDECWLACGTGLTLGALAGALNSSGIRLVGVSVLKDGGSIERDARYWQGRCADVERQVSVVSEAHCGGYAKFPDYLAAFQRNFERGTGVPLDPVYTAKMAYALHREDLAGSLSGRRILMLHTGGLQGCRKSIKK
ncbi:1-aminocyclopropane-1-carboxylate deaminase/D-cysteine desulfhydrase [Microbulbifer hainanensis]|uniref:1-aminocyclopropane-1-carboxylate deaminase/D-cysteine desulfhydrase n=1 Tax=Microbulbifer hainanensis TaxID=2735675 RepID=UPI0018660F4D|nr:pyridoxal-phosphate dependent enzyme [Microbulbifer hainanensis]